MNNDEKFMKIALQEANKAFKKEEIPVGAIIVKDGEIIAKAYNIKEEKNDATAHAEIEVIKKASKKLKRWRLNDCTMYINLEPCFMCMGAIMEARIGRLVYSLSDNKRGAAKTVIDFSKINKYHKIQIDSGICMNESKELIQNFFRILRDKRKNNEQSNI